ncbi:hapless 2-like [Sitophilus oryzae]|uniref:Hapless 2-like n=1 Tax=Sitophilus oryzae TaxID=7048 RepID=A0A6J2YAG1_SITOR|nr:hapless 2-like [Sitophilus oryzae]
MKELLYIYIFLFSVTLCEYTMDSNRKPYEENGKPSIPNNQQQPQETVFEIKAMLTKCSKKKSCENQNGFDCSFDSPRCKDSRGSHKSKCEEDIDDGTLQNCQKKISITLKVKNKGFTNCKSQFIVLDRIFDPVSDGKRKLLNPYVLKITQKPVLQSYDLVFENVVNSGPLEKVVGQEDDTFKSCNSESSNSMCSKFKYNNQEVPYSSGFCCSCNDNQEKKLDSNQNILENSQFSSNINQMFAQNEITTAEMSNDILNCSSDIGNVNENKIPEFGQLGSLGKTDFNNLKSVRSVRGRIKRGGQDCDNKFSNANHMSMNNNNQDSVHCMEFSDLWYSVNKIKNPDIEYGAKIEIFEKISSKKCQAFWKDITGGQAIFVGTTNRRYVSADLNILAYYLENHDVDYEYALDPKTQYLLIPEVNAKVLDVSQYPEVRGGPTEYLVVQNSDIDLTGRSCNKAGVGYEAFAQQPHRCDAKRDACLLNQPKDMWKHDHDLESEGKKGSYFLKNFGSLPENPVVLKHPNNTSQEDNQDKKLYMYYSSCHTSVISIDFGDDSNVVLRSDTLAIITEVYTETMNPKKTVITAKVLNSGLLSSIFYVGLSACPLDLPATFGSIISRSVLIPPQHQHVFTLEIYCELPLKQFYCSLEVLNLKQQLIALRRVRFQRRDRCVCAWYCQCTCHDTDYGAKCSKLGIEQYHAAGYQGGMPIPSQIIDFSAYDDTVSIFLYVIMFFCLTLWYMGLMKAAFGCCFLPIGLWGLDKILDLPKKINKYYESELKYEKVIYDEDGWPVHPETGKKVQNIPPATQFAVNIVFFFLFPLALCVMSLRKATGSKYSPRAYSDLEICACRASKISLASNYGLQATSSKGQTKGSEGKMK